ncbi:hypothetical protein [Antrihabitans sp. YC2-6]|uniref:hypothetical protein n=1 Tax=Antrihabitans sp. YC2-6 TaxID=2799498 RepID=UPI0018F30A9B|nr:hypothetical protein [Antrihabitans sp. YC2-6]MBJ8348362.1 hypothetical protein [Antrihabitans sp. YC2-6]
MEEVIHPRFLVRVQVRGWDPGGAAVGFDRLRPGTAIPDQGVVVIAREGQLINIGAALLLYPFLTMMTQNPILRRQILL